MFFPLIEKRRSKRKFTPRKIESEKIEKLVEAGLRAPSSRGINPWQFIVVEDPNLLEKLSSSKTHGSSFLKNAPLGIAVCADQTQSDVWVEDASIASIFIQLAAESLGLGSCWIQIRKRSHSSDKSADEYVKEVLKIPDNIMIESLIAVGYADELKEGHPRTSLDFDKVFYNMYGTHKG